MIGAVLAAIRASRLVQGALAVLAAVGALWLALARAERRGEDRIRAEAEKEAYRHAAEAERQRAAVEDDVARGADPRDRLRDQWTRPR